MRTQQSKVSSSTAYRYEKNNRTKQLKEYVNFKAQYENLLSNEKISYLKKIYPHAILGKNNQSKVVVLDRIGIIKPNELSKIIDDEALIGYTLQRLIHLSESILKEKEQIIWIIDLSGKIMQLASKKMYNNIEKIIINSQKYFPGLLHKLYFVNTPMLFDAIWNKIHELIEKQTLMKVVLLTDDIDEMLAQVDLAMLPKCLGGNKSDQILTKAQETQELNQSDEKQEEREEPQIDFSSLKMALGGLKFSSKNHPSVASTPLNTEADEQNQF